MATWTQSRVTCVAIFIYIQMSRKVKAHPVERLVDTYLKKFAKTSNTRGGKQIIEKASKLIGIALHDPCCQPAEEIILGLKEDYLLVQLTSMLNGIDARKWRESLERAKTSLENKLNNPCCGTNCPTVNVTHELLSILVGRDILQFSFCNTSVYASSSNEPDLAEFLAGELNANKNSELLPGTFTFDNEARTVTYHGLFCDECETYEFVESISGG